MNVGNRLQLIVSAAKYSEQEAHDIACLLCWIRDEQDPELIIKIENSIFKIYDSKINK